jgi:hypothetical protein
MFEGRTCSVRRAITSELTATLCRKRPSPLVRGQATTWACGIIHALGMVNFLFDSSQAHHIAASQIWEYFELSSSRHAGQIQADPRSVGHVSHGSRLVDSLDGGPESPHLDAGGQWAAHRCAPCPTRDPGGRFPPRLNPLHSRDMSGSSLKQAGTPNVSQSPNIISSHHCKGAREARRGM